MVDPPGTTTPSRVFAVLSAISRFDASAVENVAAVHVELSNE